MSQRVFGSVWVCECGGYVCVCVFVVVTACVCVCVSVCTCSVCGQSTDPRPLLQLDPSLSLSHAL